MINVFTKIKKARFKTVLFIPMDSMGPLGTHWIKAP